MNNRKFSYSFYLILVSLWWGWTVIVDMTVIPAVFRIIPDFFNAGDLGIALFSKLNNLEVIVATILVAITTFQFKKNKTQRLSFIMSLFLFAIAMFYFSYLTPKMAYLTDLWKKADLMGLAGLEGIADLQQEHQFFHRLYVGIDSAKLIILTTMILYGVYREEKWS